jgi:hypothetical protein
MKRIVRAGHPWTEVKVIALRSIKQLRREPNIDPAVIMWTHRWRVRSHIRRWRDKTTGELRTTTVGSYIKGPESMPLIEKDSVFNVRR